MIEPAAKTPWRPSITKGTLGTSGVSLYGIASHDGLNVAWVTGAILGATERVNEICRAVNICAGHISDNDVMRAAHATRRDRFERNGRIRSYDPTTPLTDGELADARAALLSLRPDSHPDYITVDLLGSGWAAIHMTWDKGGGFYDVQQTGIGRHPTRARALVEARSWARNEEIQFKERE